MTSSKSPDDLEGVGLRAQALAKSGDPDEAERIARSIPDADRFCGWLHEKAVAFVVTASVFADRAERDRAKSLLGEAVRISQKLGDGGTWQEADTLVDVGSVLVRMGATNEALEHWAKAASLSQECQAYEEECGKILAQLSIHLSEIGLWDQATRTAERISFATLRDKTLNELRNLRRGYDNRGVPE